MTQVGPKGVTQPLGPGVLTQGFTGPWGEPRGGAELGRDSPWGNLSGTFALRVLGKWLWTLWQAARPELVPSRWGISHSEDVIFFVTSASFPGCLLRPGLCCRQ